MNQEKIKNRADLRNYVEMVEELHRAWIPHAGQIEIGKALFNDLIKQIFAKCGRNFGKTDLIAYCLWRYAQSYPNSENYYFAPLAKQAKEIIWASQRLQTFGPRKWLQDGSRGINNTELRLRFKNESFIKLDGTDNIDSYRGVKPKGLSVYDEYKDFRPGFHSAMDPNYAAHDSPLLVVGTPPELEAHHFYELEDEFKTNPKKKHFEFPSTVNTYISAEWFKNKKEELYRLGNGDEWEREYEVKKIFGSKKAIFPMLKKEMLVPHKQIEREISRDKKKLEWGLVTDPGTITCHATLFAAMNPYTKKIYLLDEIYETSQLETSTGKIGPRIFQKRDELNGHFDAWSMVYDEAASWYANEILDQFKENYIPTHKSQKNKEEGLNLIKDLMLKGRLVMSDRCEKLFWEMTNYIKDDKGKIPKINDHLIDCLRYLLSLFNYEMDLEMEPDDIEYINREEKRYYTPDEDVRYSEDRNGGLEIDDLGF